MCFPLMFMVESALSLFLSLGCSLLTEYQTDEFDHVGHVQEAVAVHISHSQYKGIILLFQDVFDQHGDITHINISVAIHITLFSILLPENIFHSPQGIDIAIRAEMRMLASIGEIVLYRREC